MHKICGDVGRLICPIVVAFFLGVSFTYGASFPAQSEDPPYQAHVVEYFQLLQHLKQAGFMNDDVRKFHECTFARAFWEFKVEKGRATEEDFEIKSCVLPRAEREMQSTTEQANTSFTRHAAAYFQMLQHLKQSAFHVFSDDEIKKFHECTLARAFWEFKVKKGQVTEEDFEIKSCLPQDPHAWYWTPARSRLIKQDADGFIFGIGARMAYAENGLVIKDIIPGGPAAQQGVLRSGDIIVAVDEGNKKDGTLTALRGRTLEEMMAFLRGDKKGSVVTLEVSRGDTIFRIVLARDEIVVHSVVVRRLEEGIALIDLKEFSGNPAPQILAGLKLEERGMKLRAVVLDLRGNPGGYLDQMKEILDLFAPRGDLVIVQEKNGVGIVTDRLVTRKRGTYAKLAVAVLIDGDSASASELAAGVLRLWGARLFGQKTYGKGSLQSIFRDLKDGSAFKITTHHYFLADGTTPEGTGFMPDVVVAPESSQPQESADGAQKQDVTLYRALDYLRRESKRTR